MTKKAGTHSTLGVPFPVGEKRAHADHDYSALLGMEIEGLNGSRFRLVRIDEASGVTANKQPMHYTDESNFDVDVADAQGERIAGFLVDGQDDLDDNDYCWIQCEGDVDYVAGTSGVSAGDYLEAEGDGRLITDAAHAEGVSELRALADVSADADGVARILRKLVG